MLAGPRQRTITPCSSSGSRSSTLWLAIVVKGGGQVISHHRMVVAPAFCRTGQPFPRPCNCSYPVRPAAPGSLQCVDQKSPPGAATPLRRVRFSQPILGSLCTRFYARKASSIIHEFGGARGGLVGFRQRGKHPQRGMSMTQSPERSGAGWMPIEMRSLESGNWKMAKRTEPDSSRGRTTCPAPRYRRLPRTKPCC